MAKRQAEKFAIIADAHFHFSEGDYGLGEDHGDLAVRPLAETVKSLRVLNEANRALEFALDDIAARGIRHVVLLGDITDDGQRETRRGLSILLSHYENQYGLRFHALLGNHDVFGTRGRHRTKRFLNADNIPLVITSDPFHPLVIAKDAILSERMFCDGYRRGLRTFNNAGFVKRREDIHWETPFGIQNIARNTSSSLPTGFVEGASHQMDASYLVEAIPDVWFLMIDANILKTVERSESGDEAVVDYVDAAWTALPQEKTFLLEWIADVCSRAKKFNKKLLAFSHYPTADPLGNTCQEEFFLLGKTSMVRRLPSAEVSNLLREAGISVHFSGHMHVNDTACIDTKSGSFLNLSVPSLVAYPAAYKIVEISNETVEVSTIEIGDMELDQRVMDRYRREIDRSALPKGELFTECKTYGEFLDVHTRHLVSRRHLRRDWPEHLAKIIQTANLMDLVSFATRRDGPLDNSADVLEIFDRLKSRAPEDCSSENIEPASKHADLEKLTMLSFMEDWYKLRMGGELAQREITRKRVDGYGAIAQIFRDYNSSKSMSLGSDFKRIFSIYEKYIKRNNSIYFSLSIQEGSINY